jgi:type IV secretory pathway TrbD component
MSSWISNLSSRRGSNSERSVSKLRLFFEAARNAVIVAIILGALTQLVIRNTIVTGIVGWVVFLVVLGIQVLLFRP